MKRSWDIAQTTPAWLALVCLGLCLLLPGGVTQRMALAASYAALPEGGAVSVYRALQPSATAVGQAEETAASVLPAQITQTPDDILQWMDEARQRRETKDGEIRAQTFGAKSATDTFRSLRIRNVTQDVRPDYEAVWDTPLPLSVDRDKPAVLLYHTHTTEGYELLDRDWYAADVVTRTDDARRNVVRVGDAIAQELERGGFLVLHDRTVHDLPYSGAYNRSRDTVEGYLRQYPQLTVTLDVHRDAIQQNNGVKIKPVTDVAGKQAAQIMLIAGAEGGNVTDFPHWEQNLAFALRLQDACEATAPTLMRPIFFCHRKYNMDLTPCSLLVEVGSDANTLEEAVYAGRLFGRALSQMLQKYIQ